MGRLTIEQIIEHCEKTTKQYEEKVSDLFPVERIQSKTYWEHKQVAEYLKELQKYKDLEEQGGLIDWRKTAEEKPDSTRHLIVADGEIISHYGYYLKPKDKWFTNWKCEEEISAPIFWADMPEPPKESLHSDCGAKLKELE